jgi:hypothetical protein
MEKRAKLSTVVTLILGCFSFSWLIYDVVAFGIIKPLTVTFQELGPREETLGVFVWLGYLVLFVFHVSAILTLILQLQNQKKADVLKGMALFICILSLFALMGDYSLLNDIGKESNIGVDVEGEWFVLYLVTILHGLAHLFVFFSLFQSLRKYKNLKHPEQVVKEEAVFVTAQFVGILSGAVGLWVNFSFLFRQIPPSHYGDILPFYLLCFLPYGLTALIWLMLKLRDKPADWYDEKQWQDIAKAALVALVLSIPGMALLFFVSHPLGMFWFTHYFFLVLLLFSGSTLYFNLNIGQHLYS